MAFMKQLAHCFPTAAAAGTLKVATEAYIYMRLYTYTLLRAFL